MATFVRLEAWTDVACAASAARVATLEPDMLASAVLTTSLTGPESLQFETTREFTQAAELVHGRVVRVVWSDTTRDTEWRIIEIVDQSGEGDRSQLLVTCQAIALDLGRAVFVDFDSNGRPMFDFSAVQLTATEWIDNYVLPACVEAGLTWIARGTIDYTTEFDLDGEFVSAFELIRAIQQPGRAPGEFALRRNGSTSYLIDIVTARGSSAETVRVQTAKNLLANRRTRRLNEVGTVIVPRGAADAAVRDMSQAYWRVKTVVSATVAELEDPAGGAGPIGFDDQLNGLYVAPIASSFSSQVISDSDAATQRITVASTAGYTAGTTLLRFFRTSGSSGERLISLAHPTRSLAPSAGGYGKVTRFADVPGVLGDANILTNPFLSTWTNAANPPDGYTKIASGLTPTVSREASVIRLGTYSYKFVINQDTGLYYGPSSLTALNSATAGICGVYSPTATPFTTAGLTEVGHAWVQITARTNGGLQLVAADASTLVPFAWGPVVTTVDEWVKLTLQGLDCASHANGVILAVVTAPDWIAGQPYWGTPWANNLTFYVDSMGFGEADAPIGDVLYSGGTALWQRANVVLAAISDIVTGYGLRVADLARLDGSAWSDEPLTLGGNVEVVDTDLSVTTTQRVVDMAEDLKHPLDTEVQLATPETLLTNALAGTSLASGGSIGGSAGVVTTVGGTAASRGVTDVYTKAEMDELLAEKSRGALLAHARITATTATTATVRVAVADPSELGATTSATIHYTEYNLGAATSPATGQTATPAPAVNEVAGSYVDFTVTRPTSGAGGGAILFVVQATGRESATASVSIPAHDSYDLVDASTIGLHAIRREAMARALLFGN